MSLGPSQRETRGGREEREQEASRARSRIARRASKVCLTEAVVIEDARVQGEVNLYESVASESNTLLQLLPCLHLLQFQFDQFLSLFLL